MHATIPAPIVFQPLDEKLFWIQNVVEDDLLRLVSDPNAYAFDLFEKIQEIWTYFDTKYQPIKPDWTVFQPPTTSEVTSLCDAIEAHDIELVEFLVCDLARNAGLTI